MIKNNSQNQIETMRHLINYGKVNENTVVDKPIVEFQKQAANGKTYGIVRESNKYYIMEAPQKDTKVLAEDFQYIGGFNNRKENEYSSYAKASNALDLKIMSINETVEKGKAVAVTPELPQADWENKITESMRNEIDRFNRITTNAKRILKEEAGDIIPSSHTLPEAPAKNPSEDKVNSPFTDTATANGDKDFTKKETDHTKTGKPFNEDGTVTDGDMQNDKNPKTKDNETYSQKPQYVDTGVAGKKTSGGKVVRVNEGTGRKTHVKLKLEQILAWNDNKDLLDTSNGTEIGSSSPYNDEVGEESNQTEAPTEKIHEDVAVHNTDNQNDPQVGTNEVGDGQPFENKPVNEEAEVSDIAGMPDDDDDDDVPFPEVEDDWYKDDTDYEIELDDDSEAYNNDAADEFTIDRANRDIQSLLNHEDDYDDDYGMFESRRRLSEDKLKVFGKHPAYRKVPMTTPPNKEVAINGAHEWDDESAQGEEPFGTQIGDGSPYDDVVDTITDVVYEALYCNKKKV